MSIKPQTRALYDKKKGKERPMAVVIVRESDK
jgi:hypothetical protein